MELTGNLHLKVIHRAHGRLHITSPKTLVMLPETILRSDLLDILFDNRNKSYGAYDLRKNYQKNLLKALVMVTVLAGLMVGFLPPRIPKSGSTRSLLSLHDSVHIVQLSPLPDRPIRPAAGRSSVKHPRRRSTQDPPRIVADTRAADSLPLVKDLLQVSTPGQVMAGIGNKPGLPGAIPAGANTGSGEKEIPVRNRPFEKVQIMPEYPGGPEAFKKYLSSNIPQPDDLEAGEQLQTKIRFVIESDGTVSGLEVIKTGRQDLDAAILRVLKKMPKWIPGVQNGKNVAVYFVLPVTFVGGEQ